MIFDFSSLSYATQIASLSPQYVFRPIHEGSGFSEAKWLP